MITLSQGRFVNVNKAYTFWSDRKERLRRNIRTILEQLTVVVNPKEKAQLRKELKQKQQELETLCKNSKVWVYKGLLIDIDKTQDKKITDTLISTLRDYHKQHTPIVRRKGKYKYWYDVNGAFHYRGGTMFDYVAPIDNSPHIRMRLELPFHKNHRFVQVITANEIEVCCPESMIANTLQEILPDDKSVKLKNVTLDLRFINVESEEEELMINVNEELPKNQLIKKIEDLIKNGVNDL